jgi:hypothetical protein
MGRHVVRITITDEGRDRGKVFELREMDAVAGEKWAMRCLNAAMQGGVNLGEIEPVTGMAGVAGLGLLAINALAKMPWALAEPLLDEMMTCVHPVSPDGTLIRERLMAEDTEEIATRLRLRQEVASLHLGFSLAEAFSKWMSGILTQISSNTPPSPEPSASSSSAARRRGRN